MTTSTTISHSSCGACWACVFYILLRALNQHVLSHATTPACLGTLVQRGEFVAQRRAAYACACACACACAHSPLLHLSVPVCLQSRAGKGTAHVSTTNTRRLRETTAGAAGVPMPHPNRPSNMSNNGHISRNGWRAAVVRGGHRALRCSWQLVPCHLFCTVHAYAPAACSNAWRTTKEALLWWRRRRQAEAYTHGAGN